MSASAIETAIHEASFDIERQRAIAQKAIAKHSFCTLATSSSSNVPHVVGVRYVVIDGALYITMFDDSVKVRNIRDNPRVAVCIPARKLPMFPPFAVQFQGRADMLPNDDPEIVRLYEAGAFKRIISKDDFENPHSWFARIARDVHDVVAHTLAVTMLHITAARMAVKRGAPDVAVEALEEAERQGRSSLGDIRRIVQLLRAEEGSTLDATQPGLSDIDALVQRYRSAGLAVDLTLSTTCQTLPATTELALYRVLQEALTNAARHGGGAAAVELGTSEIGLNLRVENSLGRQPVRSSRGSGLIGMRERIVAAGGTIESGVRDGRWVVSATLPAMDAA